MKNLAIICGGPSAEHEVSIVSARNVIRATDKTKYKVIPLIVSREGTFYKSDDLPEGVTECRDASPIGEACGFLSEFGKAKLFTVLGQKIDIDVAFPLIHGPGGEDGAFQGFMETVGLPYVGAGISASALGMDKDLSKRIWERAGIKMVPYFSLREDEKIPSYEEASERLGSKILFVKPAIMGSSVGVLKAKSENDYYVSVKKAFEYGSKILVEKFVPCREIECSVLGNRNPSVSVTGEISPKHEFYSYEAKYIDPEGADLFVPADICEKISDEIRAIALKAYEALGVEGMARVDFFLGKEDGEIYLNEINTIPGFTNISMYPKLWEASGLDYTSLITKLIDLAFDKYERKRKISLNR